MNDLVPGVVLKDRYRIVSRLGSGGMGEVYLGFDGERNGPVAIKRLRLDLQSHQEMFNRRFREEVGILQRLHMAGVPEFIDAFEVDGISVLVMEFIEGHSLGALLIRAQASGAQGLPVQLVVRVGIQVCNILEYLHTHRPPLVHRDVKPDNIIIRTYDEQVFLVDFGLAREVDSKNSMKTVVGTAAYAPLEQFQGKPEARSDIYSLGVTMNELLSGNTPTPLNVVEINQLMPDLHEDLVRIINRATRSEAESRYPSASDMCLLLEDVLPRLEEFTPARPSTNRKDLIEDMIQRWGKGQPRPPSASLAPPSPRERLGTHEVRWGDDPVLRRNVMRAGARAESLFATRRSKVGSLLIVLGIVILAVLGTLWWSARQDLKGQALLLSEQYSLGDGWKLVEAGGLFPAEGIGLGSTDARRSGFLYTGNATSPLRSMTWTVHRLKGSPRILAFVSPWGILIEPSKDAKDRYEARVVTMEAPTSLDSINARPRKDLTPAVLGGLGEVRLQLYFSGGKGFLTVDGRTVQSFTTPPATSGARGSGIIMLDSAKNSRCIVKEWKFL